MSYEAFLRDVVRVDPAVLKYCLHLPDGNATIARLLVRKLVPRAVPGNSVEDVVTARVNYAELDRIDSPATERRVAQVGEDSARVRQCCTA